MVSPERWVIRGFRVCDSGASVGSDYSAAARKPATFLLGPHQLPQRALTLLASASPVGALHPTGGGDGWDGAGNQHERNRGSD